jgi:hypothetical protein
MLLLRDEEAVGSNPATPTAGTASAAVPSRRRVSLAWPISGGLGRLGHPSVPVLASFR